MSIHPSGHRAPKLCQQSIQPCHWQWNRLNPASVPSLKDQFRFMNGKYKRDKKSGTVTRNVCSHDKACSFTVNWLCRGYCVPKARQKWREQDKNEETMLVPQVFSTKWVWVFSNHFDGKDAFLQNGLQAHSNNTCNINTTLGVLLPILNYKMGCTTPPSKPKGKSIW